jgi:hypothetical protein
MASDIVTMNASDEISVIVRTADQTRKAELTVAYNTSCGELIAAAVENWSLDSTVDYSIANVTQNIALDPDESLLKSQVVEGDMLEVQPVLVAGYDS